MTIVEMGSYFDLLQDKFGSPYYTDSEKTTFLQRAHVGFVKDLLFPDAKEEEGLIELTQDTMSFIDTLVYTLPYVTMDSSGIVLKSTLDAALVSIVPTGVIWRPLAIGWTVGGDNRPVKFVRHNDWWEFQENYFKNPTAENPKFRDTALSYQFLPVNTTTKLYFTVLKFPKKVVLDSVTPANNVNSDLPDETHDRIVALALEYAGIASRDTAMAQLLQLKTKP